jgi:hypothetical protein
VKRVLSWALYDTAAGDWLLWTLERLTGLTVVPVEDIAEQKVGATAFGRRHARVS